MNQSQETLLTSIEKPRFTGKTLVMLNPETSQKRIFSQAKNASLRLAAFSEYAGPESDFNKAFDEGDGIVFERLGIAVINEHRDREVSMLTESATAGNTFLYSEPERYIYALNGPFDDFLTGYKSAVDDLYNRLVKKRRNK